METEPKSREEPFLNGMNIFFLVVAIFVPVYSITHRYYIQTLNPRAEFWFSDLIPQLICSLFLFFVVLFDVVHRQHKRIKVLEKRNKLSEED